MHTRDDRAAHVAKILREMKVAGLVDRELPAVQAFAARLSAYVRGEGWSGVIKAPELGVQLVVKLSLTRPPVVRLTRLSGGETR